MKKVISMKKICNETFDEERALYHLEDALVENCQFKGPRDGESFLKEARNIVVRDCYMDLRYPLWHNENTKLENILMTENCRAALWYDHNVVILKSNLLGIKAVRECENVQIVDSKIISDEFFWRSKKGQISSTSLESVYAFFEAEELKINNLTFKGKYSFQYVKNVEVRDSNFDTKDAFWHAENVIVYNTVLKGEYLAWYSKNLTLVNCKIIGTQPFCYCENLKLIDCEMEATDLAFENSSVEATIKGEVLSIKNPRSGHIVCDTTKEIIKDAFYPTDCLIEVKDAK